MTIHTKLSNHSNYKAASRIPSAIRYLVMHYTGNRGDTAKNNADYFARESIGTSAHYFVDETAVWQSVADKDIAWHCGAKSYKHPVCRNTNSIGIEICMLDKQGNIRQGSIDRAARLVRELMAKYKIPATNVLRHYDVTGKDCPAPMVHHSERWAAFQAAITQKEDDIVTQDQFNAMYNNINPLYTSLAQVPHYWRQETKALMDVGAIRGDGRTEIAIRDGELKAAIIARRCMLAAVQ